MEKCCSNRKRFKKIFPKKTGINFIYKLFGMEENIVKLEIVTELLVKFVKAVIQIEKNQLKQRKHN